MVTLINLKRIDNLIITDYFLDDNNDDKGHIEYDISRNSVIQYSYSREDDESNIKYGFRKAIAAIEKLIEYGRFPEKYRYIWY